MLGDVVMTALPSISDNENNRKNCFPLVIAPEKTFHVV